MASKQKRKLEKKKEREKSVRKKVLSRRESLRAPEREERAFQNKLKRIKKVKKSMGDHNLFSDEVLLKMDEKTLQQLEKNAKILKALEDEYNEESNKKKTLNQHLESEGFKTLEEKLSHLHDKLISQQKEEAGNLSLVNSSGREVSDVEVVKAKNV